MSLVDVKRPHFRYLEIGEKTFISEKEAESLTHRYVKETLSMLTEMKFKLGSKGTYKYEEVTIYPDKIDVESCFKRKDKKYYVDLLVYFNRSVPEEYLEKWDRKVAIEIFVEHETEGCKAFDLEQLGIQTIEVEVSDAFKIDKRKVSDEYIEYMKDRMNKYYSDYIIGNMINNVESDLYIANEKNKKSASELLNFRNQVSNLKKEILLLNKTVKSLKDENNLLYEENKAIASKEKQYIKHNKYLEELINEKNLIIEESKKPFWKKVFKL